MSQVSYWVRYRAEDDHGGYAIKMGKAGTILALAAQIAEISGRGWQIIAVGAQSPRGLDDRERRVLSMLTHGLVQIP